MTDGPRRGAGQRPRKPSLAERREKRAAVEDVGVVVDAAARLLEARPRSVAEVRRRLGTSGYRSELVDAAIERLSALHYLDDDAFARAWIESRDRAHPRGEHALRRELALKGIDRAIVAGLLDERRDTARDAAAAADVELVDPDDAAAERLLRRRLAPILRETDRRKRNQRAYALLARSGFSPGVCSAVSRRVLDDAASGGEPTDEEPLFEADP